MFSEDVLKGKWVVGVSGGPDSMALLDMLVKANVEVCVAHVNYHKRETANRDQRCVENYCLTHQLSYTLLQPRYTKGNFQSWARDVRYQFFFDLVKEKKYDGVMIAHHLEDAVETYLLQKQRNLDIDYVGLCYQREIDGVKIIRPLLKYTKEQLMEYCHQNGVEYHHDESNFSDDYTRNQIRHTTLAELTYQQQLAMLDEMEIINANNHLRNAKLDRLILKTGIALQSYLDLSKEDRFHLLRRYLMKNIYRKEGYSSAYLTEIDSRIQCKENFELKIEDKIFMLDYDVITIKKEEIQYEDIYSMIQFGDYQNYSICKQGSSLDAVTVDETDFPLTIRNVMAQDEIRLRFGKKKINRFFIDRKIRKQERNGWPVVVNCKGEIILVPGLGCDVCHYSVNPSFFVKRNVIK